MKKFRYILIAIALCVFVFSAYQLLSYYTNGAKEENSFKTLREEKKNDEKSLMSYYKKNKDFVGWLEIEGTKIDYPVMQTPNDPEYYLRRNFNKEDAVSGSIFCDGRSDLKKSKNILIYGHNMNNGTMFHDLLKYKDKEFRQKHKTIQFDTLKEKGTYKIIAGGPARVELKNSENFKYYNYANITSEEEFNSYLKGIVNISDYSFLENIHYGDELITLSTCSYHTDDESGRYVVIAKKIK
ncbi:MAG: class B sortase [Anaerovoracaceae bacterium]